MNNTSSTDDNTNKDVKWSDKSLVRLFVIIIASVWFFIGFAIPFFFFGSSAERGTFGDMFGAVNSLFSGLAFGGVIYAILLQREELQLQREELKLTRGELHDSATAHQTSAEALKRQIEATSLAAQLSAFTSMNACLKKAYLDLELAHDTQVGNHRQRIAQSLERIKPELAEVERRTEQILKRINEFKL